MTTPTDLAAVRAAAERAIDWVKRVPSGHPWEGDGPEQDTDTVALASYALATIPADATAPITAEWLREAWRFYSNDDVHKFKDKDGKWQYKNGFVSVKRFYNDKGNPDWLLETAVKGTDVVVTGKLGFEQWETKEGEKKSKLTIIADNIQFMDASSSTERGADNRRPHKGYKGKAGRDTGSNSRQYEAPDPDDGDDTPF